MKLVFNRDRCREWFEIRWLWELRDKFRGILNIYFLFQYSRAKIEIETSLKVLSNQVLIERDFAEGFKFLR